ncbi:hypothetical protein HDU67_001544 [Dinochytrium kinnereticum]|nr:hypothetical protein HDU67_001544 [Dinochytrium kinnereticum]
MHSAASPQQHSSSSPAATDEENPIAAVFANLQDGLKDHLQAHVRDHRAFMPFAEVELYIDQLLIESVPLFSLQPNCADIMLQLQINLNDTARTILDAYDSKTFSHLRALIESRGLPILTDAILTSKVTSQDSLQLACQKFTANCWERSEYVPTDRCKRNVVEFIRTHVFEPGNLLLQEVLESRAETGGAEEVDEFASCDPPENPRTPSPLPLTRTTRSYSSLPSPPPPPPPPPPPKSPVTPADTPIIPPPNVTYDRELDLSINADISNLSINDNSCITSAVPTILASTSSILPHRPLIVEVSKDSSIVSAVEARETPLKIIPIGQRGSSLPFTESEASPSTIESSASTKSLPTPPPHPFLPRTSQNPASPGTPSHQSIFSPPFPSLSFTPEILQDVAHLRSALRSTRADTTVITQILGWRAVEDVFEIARAFESVTGGTLVSAVKERTFGGFGGLVEKVCCRCLEEFDVEGVVEACSGIGIDKNVLIEVFVGRTNKEIENMKRYFYDTRPGSGGMVSFVVGRAGAGTALGECLRVMLEDVKGLILTLCRLSYDHLRQTSMVFDCSFGKGKVSEVLGRWKGLGGEVKDMLGAIVRYAEDAPLHIAHQYHASLKGLGTLQLTLDLRLLTRLVIRNRRTEQARKISMAYEDYYGVPLRRRIEERVRGGEGFRELVGRFLEGV